MINFSDDEVVSGLLFGDKELEEYFYDVYTNLIKNYILSNYGTTVYIDDDVSDILIKALININKFDSTKSKLKTWIIRITKNHMIDKWRKTTTGSSVSNNLLVSYASIDTTLSGMDDYSSNAISTIETNDTIDYLQSQISISDYKLLEMKYVLGYDYKEIGNLVGKSSINISNRVNYIKTKLKNNICEFNYGL